MKKKVVLGLSSALALSLLIGSLAEGGNLLNVRGETTNLQTCADITFGTSFDGTDTSVPSTSSFTTKNLTVSSVDSTKVFCKSQGYAAHFGSSSAVGTLTFTFAQPLVISKVKVLAWLFGSDTGSKITITTSAQTSGTAQTITDSSAPDISDSSTDSGYVFSNLDGGTGASSSTLSVTSSVKRFYLAKIVLTLNGSSLPASSSAASSAATSSGVTSSQSGAATYYRVAPSQTTAATAPVYSVTYQSGLYQGSLVKTLTKGAYYTDYADVAAYWQAFGGMPGNYMCADGDSSSGYSTTKSEAYAAYGESARLWFTYHRTTGYMTQVPSYNTYGDGTNEATYYEIDIATSWSSYSSNRGALRLMAMPYGLTQYGVAPVIFYTADHYSNFSEYYNYSGGWGPSFSSRSDYVAPSTVTFTVA